MMATKAMAQGPAGNRFGRQLRELRDAAGLDQPALAARLAELGHPLPVSSISRLENGERRADISDLVALAVALNVAPGRLYLPHTDAGEPVTLTEGRAVAWEQAWAWASGERSLEAEIFEDGMSLAEIMKVAKAKEEWRLLNQPHIKSGRLTSEEFDLLSEHLATLVQPLRDAMANRIGVHEVLSFVKFVMTMDHPSRSGIRGSR